MKTKKTSTFKYSMSLAASWAWGTSLIVGMELIQTKGIIPFVIWSVANSLSIPLFGFLAFRIPNFERIINSKPVLIFSTFISVFCLWIQMNAIYQQTSQLGVLETKSLKCIIIVVMICFCAILYDNGVIKSVLIDSPMWAGCYIVLLFIVIYGVFSETGHYNIVCIADNQDIKWALNSCLILFSGPIMCIQNWQVANDENKMHAHYIAGGLFAVYITFVGFLGFYKFDGIMKIAMSVVVIIVALSTADAAIVGLQEILGRKIGLLIEGVAIMAWPMVISVGVMNLWTIMGNARKYVTALCVIIAYILYFKQRGKKNAK